MNRRPLQIVNVILALWILFRAGLTMLEGTNNPMLGAAVPRVPALDSNLRFLAGIGMAMAVYLIWLTPSIATRTTEFRVVWVLRFFGGLGRLISLVAVGAPPIPMLVLTVSEPAFIPILLYWQGRVSASKARSESSSRLRPSDEHTAQQADAADRPPAGR